MNMRTTFINTLSELAEKNREIIFLTADIGYSVVEDFRIKFPKQFINVGIAEASMIGISAGLSLSGKKVFLFSMVPFITMRCFEQIRIDLCYQNLDVVLVGVGGGFAYGTSGSTHHAIEDIAIMRALPEMKVYVPADPYEVNLILHTVVESKGPSYIRLGKNGETNLPTMCPGSETLSFRLISKGNDLTILACGPITSVVLKTIEILKSKGLSATLYSVPQIRPINQRFLMKLLEQDCPIFSVEEHNITGGFGGALAELIAESNKKIVFKRLGILDKYPPIAGSQNYLCARNGLTPDKIANEILSTLNSSIAQ